MDQFHDIRPHLQGLARNLYDSMRGTNAVDWQRVKNNAEILLAEGGSSKRAERLWLRMIYACALRETGGATLDTVIGRLNALLGAPHEARLHGLMVAIYAELVHANHQAGNTFMASMMAINLRLAACPHAYCQGHLAALGLGNGFADIRDIETAVA